MTKFLYSFALSIALAAVSASSSSAQGLVLTAENTHVILAAKFPGSGDGLRSDPGTIGEFYATNNRAYNPVVKGNLPDGWAQAQIWVRQRGGPFQLKGNGGGSELLWNWDSPATWTWQSYGSHSRDQLTSNFLFIRSDNLAFDAGIDVVILIRDEGEPRSADLDLMAKQAAAVVKK